MSRRDLHVVVRTPREVVAEFDVQSLRVPTETGQVGVRPRSELTVTPVEPGLVLARADRHVHFIGTAGGLLRAGAFEAVLLTPVAVLGDEPAAVAAAVNAAVTGPDPERDLRQAIERLETGLLRHIRGDGSGERR